MGLFLNRGNDGLYRRTWFATIFRNGKKTTQVLKTPLRGTIPVDSKGRFSLLLTGDEAFEKSRNAAQAEFDAIMNAAKEMKAEERNSPGYAEREAYHKTTGKAFDIVRLDELADRNAARNRYALTGDERTDRYNLSVHAILTHFCKWCEIWSNERPKAERIVRLTDITSEIVSVYYADITNGNAEIELPVQTKSGIAYKPIEPLSWQSFRKYVFTLASVFRYFMPKIVENPFERVYEDCYKGRKAPIDKTTVVHESPSLEQMRKLWGYAQREKSRPYLRRLSVLAACTGMRIGDCCKLTWDKVDMINFRLTTKTSKTGKRIAVPIFAYDPSSSDYHETLGELRRELEAALVEGGGSPYVIPEAAQIYHDDPTRINKIGKAAFAHALFDPDEPEDVPSTPNPTLSPAQILKAIQESRMQPQKKARLQRVYELHLRGCSCAKIATAIGKRKGSVSEDLAEIENLTGEKIRVGNPYLGTESKPGLQKLLKKTRRARAQGQRAACLYGWHSCRVFFVVTAIDAGISPDDLRHIVGHATVNMVLHYYNPEELVAAEKMRAQLRRKRTAALPPPPPAPATANTALLAATIQSILANPDLTPEARNAAILALTAR